MERGSALYHTSPPSEATICAQFKRMDPVVSDSRGRQSELSCVYIFNAKPHCLSLLQRVARCAAAFDRASAGSSIAAKSAMMAITTSNSINVNPRNILFDFIDNLLNPFYG